MTDLLLGVLAGVTASALFSAGLILQAAEARSVGAEHSLHLSLIGELARRPRWLVGGAISLAGFGFHVGALLLAPLTVVQPALAAGLLFLVVIAVRSPTERVGPREWLGTAAIVLGVVGLTFSAPERAGTTNEAGSLALALGVLALVVALPHALAYFRLHHGDSGSLPAALGSGAAYALTGVTTKLMSDDLAAEAWLGAGAWLLATALVATLAFVDQTTALQGLGATEVGPIVFVMPVVIPVLLAPLIVGESWGSTPLSGGALAVSVAVVGAGAAALSSSPSLAGAESSVSDAQVAPERVASRS